MLSLFGIKYWLMGYLNYIVSQHYSDSWVVISVELWTWLFMSSTKCSDTSKGRKFWDKTAEANVKWMFLVSVEKRGILLEPVFVCSLAWPWVTSAYCADGLIRNKHVSGSSRCPVNMQPLVTNILFFLKSHWVIPRNPADREAQLCGDDLCGARQLIIQREGRDSSFIYVTFIHV